MLWKYCERFGVGLLILCQTNTQSNWRWFGITGTKYGVLTCFCSHMRCRLEVPVYMSSGVFISMPSQILRVKWFGQFNLILVHNVFTDQPFMNQESHCCSFVMQKVSVSSRSILCLCLFCPPMLAVGY